MLGILILLGLVVAAAEYLRDAYMSPNLAFNLAVLTPYVLVSFICAVTLLTVTWSIVGARENAWRRRRDDGEFFSQVANRRIAELYGSIQAKDATIGELWARIDSIYELGGMMHAHSMINTEMWDLLRRNKRIEDTRGTG